MKNFIIIILGFVVFASCGKSNKDKSFSLLQKWIGKELSLPARSVFTIQGKDTVEYPIQNTYKILTYIDSTGCTSCKLKLAEWEKFITVVDSIRPHTVQFLFFLCPKNGMEIYQTLRVERFKHPICIAVNCLYIAIQHGHQKKHPSRICISIHSPQIQGNTQPRHHTNNKSFLLIPDNYRNMMK